MRSIRIYNGKVIYDFLPGSRTMIVCVCRRVSDREIARHARAGMNFDDIQFELGVATQCGQCESCARDVVAQCSSMAPMAAIHLADSIRNSVGWKAQPASAQA